MTDFNKPTLTNNHHLISLMARTSKLIDDEMENRFLSSDEK